jgi:hypothetical protein
MIPFKKSRKILKAWLYQFIGSYRFEFLIFFVNHLKFPDLKSPTTFNEKLVWRKFYDHNPIYVQLADKWQVREYVRMKVREEVLTKVFWVGKDLSTINLANLPDKFVIKANHGSGKEFIYFVDNKNRLNPALLKRIGERLITNEFGVYTNEWWYTKIDRRIIVEELLNTNSQTLPLDYKFFVFHGKVCYIQVDYDRFLNHTRTFYDRNWVVQPFEKGGPRGPISDPTDKLDLMIEIAEKLSSDFDFVRVDLYNIGDRVIFGELTFCPGAGMGSFKPWKWDIVFGSCWNLEKR